MFAGRVWGLALVASACAVTAGAQRLPATITPEHYEIHFAPDFDSDTFDGRVSITVQAAEPTREVSLHAAEMQVHEAAISARGAVQQAAIRIDERLETLTLVVPQPIPAGRAVLTVRYTGRLNDQLRGFYLSRANGRKYGITQLEPTDARRAFPSFDEPALKATFAVSATIDAADTAISNGRLLSDTPGPGPGKHTLTFAPTKRMSTYLVALVVGDWTCIAGGADGVPIRLCSTPDRKHELGFALEAAEFAMRYFNRYFTIKYPFDKLDIIAAPDFAAGAMENTGAIIFRDEFLLVPPEGGSTDRRKQVTAYIGHEIAHQWFGDLVTMRWWDDIWLNEGFATWLERRPAEEARPEWQSRLDEVRDTERAMAVDMLRTTRPVRTRVETPAEINEVFDSIAYQKTAALIRMVEGYVGERAYRDAINAYLKTFAFANASGEDLWTLLAKATKRPVDRIFAGYITQPGMPLVDVRATCERGRTEIALSQEPISDAAPPSTLWEVPVCYKRSLDGKVEAGACTLLSGRTATLSLDGCSPWVFANVDARGYYRVGYTPDQLRALRAGIARGELTPVEQTALLQDLWALVWLNRRTVDEYLALAGDLIAVRSPAVETALVQINLIADRFVDASVRPDFQRWVQTALAPLAATLGWTPSPGEPDETASLRAAVLYTLGNAGGDPAVLREARRLVDQHLAGGAPLHPDLAWVAADLAALTGGADLYDRYLARIASGAAHEQSWFRDALTHFDAPGLRRRTLELATSTRVRPHEAPALISGLMRRPGGGAATWDYLKSNWDDLYRSMGMFQALPDVVGSTRHFCDTAARDDVRQFFSTRGVPGAERTLARALESIERCAAAKTAQRDELASFLRAPAAR